MKSLAAIFCIFSISLHAADRPNLLIFLVDDMGLMDSSVPFLTDAKGKPETHPLNKFYRTPSMERLAKNGICFEQFYANSVCSPSRISLMTGRSSARHHATTWINPAQNNRGALGPKDWQWNGLTKNDQTLPRLLQNSGYRTIHVGKAHFGPQDSEGENPQNIGYDVNIAGCAIGQPGIYYGTDNFGAKEGRKTHAVPGLEKYHGKDIYLTEALTLEMNTAIGDAVKNQQPFLASMAYYAVHAPFQPNRKYLDHYANATYPQTAKVFATMIESMDVSVGQILDELEKLGVAENTLVLFLGDNGSDSPLGSVHDVASSAPLRGKKGTHYEGGMRVPFIAAWAKPNADNKFQKQLPIAAGMLTREMADVTDIMPTLLAAANVKATEPMDGEDIATALQGGKLNRTPEFLMHFPHDHRSSYFTSYREGDWKIVYHYTKPVGERCELFNLSMDRAEQHNLAAEKPELRKEMITKMAKSLEKHEAQYPLESKDSVQPMRPVVE